MNLFSCIYRFRLIELALAVLLVGGCAVIPIPYVFHNFEEKDIAFIKNGVTTKTEIQKKFGEPLIASGNKWVYEWETATGYEIFFFFTYGTGQSFGVKRYSLILEFDDRGIVKSSRFRKQKFQKLPFSVAKKLKTPRHTKYIAPFEYSSDGRIMATAHEGNQLVLSDLISGETLWRHEVKSRPKDVIYPSNYRSVGLVFSTDESLVELWDVAANRRVAMLAHPDVVVALVFSPNGKMLATADKENVRIWHVASGRLINTIQYRQFALKWWESGQSVDQIIRLAFSPNGELIALSKGDAVYVWEISGSKVATIRAHRPLGGGTLLKMLGNHGIVFSPDGIFFALACGRHTEIWRVIKRPGEKSFYKLLPEALLPRWGQKTELISFSPDRHWLVSGSIGPWRFTIWDYSRQIHWYIEPTQRIVYLSVDPDSTKLLVTVGSGFRGQNRTPLLIDLNGLAKREIAHEFGH